MYVPHLYGYQRIFLREIYFLDSRNGGERGPFHCRFPARVFFLFQIREDWKYVAMVIDRLQLYLFFIVTTAGTLGILMDAPHIFETVDQDKIIEIYGGK